MWEYLGVWKGYSGYPNTHTDLDLHLPVQVLLLALLTIAYSILQINSKGELIDSASSSYFLLDETVAGHVTNVPSADIYPTIVTPLNSLTLQRTLPLLQIVLKHNFVSGLLVIAGCVMSLHYSAVIKLNSGCPMVIATGESETGKSTAIKAAISLTGRSAKCFLSSIYTSVMIYTCRCEKQHLC